MTLKMNHDLDILKMYLQTEKKLPELQKYKDSSQGQMSRSNVTKFQTLLAFPMGHVSTKLRRLLTSSFRDFLPTDRHTHRQTPPKTIEHVCK